MHIFCKNKIKWSTNVSVVKIFSRKTSIPPQRDQIANIFGPSATSVRGLHVSLTFHTLTFRKWYAQKKHLDTALFRSDWEREIKDFLKGGGGIKKGSDCWKKENK